MKKTLALLLAVMMIVCTITACGGTASSQEAPASQAESQTESQEESKPEAASPAESASEEASSEEAPAETAEEPVTIIWKGWGDKPANYDSVMAALNEKLMADLGVQLQYDFMGTDFGSAMSLVLAGNEEWDLCWTATWNGCNYFGDAETTYLALDDYLPTYAPDIMATIPPAYWDALKVKGKIYAMPNYQINSDQTAIAFQADKMDAAGIVIPEECTSWEEADQLFAQIKAAYPDDYLAYAISSLSSYYSAGWFSKNMPVFAVNGGTDFWWYYNADTLKVDWDAWMTDVKTELEYAKKWNEAGYAPEDMLTLERTDDLFTEGILLGDTARFTPVQSTQGMYGVDRWYWMKTTPVRLASGGIASTLIAVNQKSKNPEKAIELFNYLYSNEEAANILFYGVEGQDYEKLDAKHIRQIEGGWSANPWTSGNTFIAYLLEGQPDDLNEQTLAMDQSATPVPLFGFVFDPEPVQAEYAAVNDIYGEYTTIIVNGFIEDIDATLQEIHDRAEAAGAQAVEDEMNRQIEAYIAEYGVTGR